MSTHATTSLDDAALHARHDPGDMRVLTAALPAQCRSAWEAGNAWPLPAAFHPPRRVTIAAVGGSATGADYLAAIAGRVSIVAVQVVRGYQPPPPDPEALLIACSFSGETEETLTAYRAWLGRPGMRLAIATGGRLAAAAREAGDPLFSYRWPGPPRSALGYSFFPLLAIARRLGVVAVEDAEVAATFAALDTAAERWGTATPEEENLAKQVARRLHGRVPVVLGGDHLATAARRWAAQINENAKQWAFHGALPEADHNLIQGLGAPAGAAGLLSAVLLDAPAMHPRTRLRVPLTLDLLDAAGIPAQALTMPAEGLLPSLLLAGYLGDWVSLYLALLNGVDPLPTGTLDGLKRTLSARE